jgi:hypothetical protein
MSDTPDIARGANGPEVARWQDILKAGGYYSGPSDGIFGAQTDWATRDMQAAHDLDASGRVGAAEWAAGCRFETPPAPLDTAPEPAPDAVTSPEANDAPKEAPAAAQPAPAAPRITPAWPGPDIAEVRAFYGRHQLDPHGQPTGSWEARWLIPINPPWAMVASWDTSHRIRSILCHRNISASLARILDRIHADHGRDQGRIEAARLHLWGGCYCFRSKRSAGSLSLHAWGAAVDIDPDRNPMGKSWNPKTGIPESAIAAFKAEGWTWGGDWKKRPDPMHFEATRP